MRFDQELLERIKDANDIVSVISEYVPLQRKGQNYWGCCPFHSEKTPSFSVSPSKGFFHCFGCKASGNAITFLMKHENYSFVEAVEKLAERANIALPQREMTQAEKARISYREKLYEVNELAAVFFHNCLTKTKLGEEGLQYLQRRGLSEETIAKFRLGFAPAGWHKLHEAFLKRGITEKILLQLGLCRENNGKVYDYFRNRVMFPICDGKGRVVGFGGRVLDDSTPKYLNSPDTEIFNKGHILYAFDKAYRTVREKRQVILVEGYMDVISAHNRGITNVVASLGTAYTKDHGRLLVRQADEIILAYDMDGAGQNAAKRAIELLQNTEFKVRVVSMPDGKDPDDYVRTHGPAAFLDLVDRAVKPFEYLLNKALIDYDGTTADGKQAVMEAVFPYIAASENSLEREACLRALAMPLWLDNSRVFRHFRDYLKRGQIETNTVRSANETALPIEAIKTVKSEEAFLVAMALSDPKAWEQIHAYLEEVDYEESQYWQIMEKLGRLYAKQGNVQTALTEDFFTEEEAAAIAKVMVMANPEQETEEALVTYIRIVKLRSLRNQYKEHSMTADRLNRAGDSRFLIELKKCQDLQALIKQWSE